MESLDKEIARNYDYFQRKLGAFLRDQENRFALLRAAQIEGFFDSATEADKAGWERFPDRCYSIQQVTAQPVELGVYANGVG